MGNKNSGLKNFTIPFDLKKEESQYWLGYICADGNIQYSRKYRIYKVSISSKDIDIINKFIQFIGIRCKYHFQRQNNMHIAYINSIQLCDYMINKLNITPKKSHVLNPKITMNRHFLRGYFDGDGSIHKTRIYSKISTSSDIFTKHIELYLDSINIYYKTRKYQKCNHINIERKKEVFQFLNHLYKNSKIYLNRKYQQYVALCGDTH